MGQLKLLETSLFFWPTLYVFSACVLAAIEKSARGAGMSTSLAEQYAQKLMRQAPASAVCG